MMNLIETVILGPIVGGPSRGPAAAIAGSKQDFATSAKQSTAASQGHAR